MTVRGVQVSSPVFHATTVMVPSHRLGGQNTRRLQIWNDSEGQRSNRGCRNIPRNVPKNIPSVLSPC